MPFLTTRRSEEVESKGARDTREEIEERTSVSVKRFEKNEVR